ncbi:MAG: calcium-binding protein [Hyphomicrobium sp.]
MKQVPVTVFKQSNTAIDASGHDILSPVDDVGAMKWVYTSPRSYDPDNDSYYIPTPDQGFTVRGSGNTLSGGAEHHYVLAFGDNNTFMGHDGHDMAIGVGDNVTIYGGDGDDTAVATSPDSRNADILSSTPSKNLVWYGGDGNDYLSTWTTNGKMHGGSGNDKVYANGDHNNITTADGNDVVNIRSGSFTTVVTGAGDDGLRIGYGHDFKVAAGSGDDRIHLAASHSFVDAGAGNDTILSFGIGSRISAGDGNDTMTGGYHADIFSGGNGNDVIFGKGGDDIIYGGSGDDTIDGGNALGFDTLSFADAVHLVSVNMSKHTADGLGHDTFKGIEAIMGSAYNDVITGDKNTNFLNGGSGNDTLRGLGGADVLTGSKGNDVFVFAKKDTGSGIDHITDFSAGDKLDLHDLLKDMRGSAIESMVRVTDGEAGSTVAVNIKGHMTDVAVLENMHHMPAADMLAHGMILS